MKNVEPKAGGRDMKTFRTSELFGSGQKKIYIEHEAKLYRLMITSQGKLILNKE